MRFLIRKIRKHAARKKAGGTVQRLLFCFIGEFNLWQGPADEWGARY